MFRERSAGRVRVTVTGWKTITLLVVLIGFWAFHQWRMRVTLGSEAVESLKPFIAGHLMRTALDEMLQGRDFDRLTADEQKTLGERLIAARRVEIKSIKVRGLTERVVVRVEFLVDCKPPPDGRTVRYYRMYYSTVYGWTFFQEVSPLFYWLGL